MQSNGYYICQFAAPSMNSRRPHKNTKTIAAPITKEDVLGWTPASTVFVGILILLVQVMFLDSFSTVLQVVIGLIGTGLVVSGLWITRGDRWGPVVELAVGVLIVLMMETYLTDAPIALRVILTISAALLIVLSLYRIISRTIQKGTTDNEVIVSVLILLVLIASLKSQAVWLQVAVAILAGSLLVIGLMLTESSKWSGVVELVAGVIVVIVARAFLTSLSDIIRSLIILVGTAAIAFGLFSLFQLVVTPDNNERIVLQTFLAYLSAVGLGLMYIVTTVADDLTALFACVVISIAALVAGLINSKDPTLIRYQARLVYFRVAVLCLQLPYLLLNSTFTQVAMGNGWYRWIPVVLIIYVQPLELITLLLTAPRRIPAIWATVSFLVFGLTPIVYLLIFGGIFGSDACASEMLVWVCSFPGVLCDALADVSSAKISGKILPWSSSINAAIGGDHVTGVLLYTAVGYTFFYLGLVLADGRRTTAELEKQARSRIPATEIPSTIQKIGGNAQHGKGGDTARTMAQIVTSRINKG